MEKVGGDGKEKRAKGLILKTLERCRSMAGQRRGGRQEAPPEGCFAVYVGPERERFVIRTECVNHPRFRVLLEEAEMEFGYSNSGPLELPCHVEVFHEVLWEMEQEAVESSWCSFGRGGGGHGGYRSLRSLKQQRNLLDHFYLSSDVACKRSHLCLLQTSSFELTASAVLLRTW
ncbi:hypothetical protein C4D60_Mb11t13570 [Musa balbisiana]|uniref:Uncharacterized protein n=1 Tax=Musa balbisiana TaxID=52838 RepID=A0A4S8J3U2_MUSBA|nr:hypothetical protein C4D60_Mb11t13570 [Musa balbisiana]